MMKNIEIEECKKKLKIFIHSMDGLGHLNACIGMAQTLAERGHNIIFLINSPFTGKLRKHGFDEIILYEKNQINNGQNRNIMKESGEMLKKGGLLSGKTSLEKYRKQAEMAEHPFLKSIFNNVRDFNSQIEDAILKEKPDFWIMDQLMIPPCILKCKIPWAYLNSANPITVYASPDLPPRASGYPTDGDRSEWQIFKEVTDRAFLTKFRNYQTELYKLANYSPTEEQLRLDSMGEFPRSEYLNIYGYPAELDYDDLVPFPEKSFRVDAFDYKNSDDEILNLPEEFSTSKNDSKLIYVSLGSMGSIDIDLMKRLLNILQQTKHRYIVSKGPIGEEYELPNNCWGKNTLPQSKILPLVDLVITHGGNNTVTETFVHAKPMIVLPLFGDQYDNAQRITEKRFGKRFNPYLVEDYELINAIEMLLYDDEMMIRLKNASERILREKNKLRCCVLIEEIAFSNEWFQ